MTTVVEAIRPAAQRGTLTLSAKVVQKITSQAASEVAAAGGVSGGVLGIGAHADLAARPRVEVELHGTTATVDIAVGLAYPTPIKQATTKIRRHVSDRVRHLCGVDITRIDITVTALQLSSEAQPKALA